jgi:hypothetical protein
VAPEPDPEPAIPPSGDPKKKIAERKPVRQFPFLAVRDPEDQELLEFFQRDEKKEINFEGQVCETRGRLEREKGEGGEGKRREGEGGRRREGTERINLPFLQKQHLILEVVDKLPRTRNEEEGRRKEKEGEGGRRREKEGEGGRRREKEGREKKESRLTFLETTSLLGSRRQASHPRPFLEGSR